MSEGCFKKVFFESNLKLGVVQNEKIFAQEMWLPKGIRM